MGKATRNGQHDDTPMQVFGIDFTSRPRRGKPITCQACTLHDNHLETLDLEEWTDFAAFERFLLHPGPWIAGIDFPFGQARRFIEAIGWPGRWPDYVEHVGAMDRQQFRATLDEFRQARSSGDKEYRRATDRAAGAISPQKLYGTPVGLMFYEGAPRLRRCGVTIPHLLDGDTGRVVVEAYPGVLARQLIGRRSYKHDSRAGQTPERRTARVELLERLNDGAARARYGLTIAAPMSLASDPAGDHLDALLCAIQAAWAWGQRDSGYGAPRDVDRLEGWISDPTVQVAAETSAR